MIVPGSNLLRLASRVIRFQIIQYYRTNGRTQNAARQWVPTFEPGFNMSCSVQAVNRKNFSQMGLDFNSFYVNLFASLDIVDLERDSSGDRFVYNGSLFQMSQNQNWHSQDGWATCLGVRIDQNPPLVQPL